MQFHFGQDIHNLLISPEEKLINTHPETLYGAVIEMFPFSLSAYFPVVFFFSFPIPWSPKS